jgi:hypothetical protein
MKIGISKNVAARMEDIDRDTKGDIKLLMKRRLYGAESTEQRMHKIFKGYHSPNRSGTGKTEWYQIPFYLRWTVLLALYYMKIEQSFLILFLLITVAFLIFEFGYLIIY